MIDCITLYTPALLVNLLVPVDLFGHLVLPGAADPTVSDERVRSADEQEICNVLEGGGQRHDPRPAAAAAGGESIVQHARLSH